jgi:hypothetical protein
MDGCLMPNAIARCINYLGLLTPQSNGTAILIAAAHRKRAIDPSFK